MKETASYNDSLQRRQDSQKSFHDHSVKEVPPLRPQEYVRVQDPHSKKWVPGQVTEVLSAPRSYRVETSSGSNRRNRKHLRRTPDSLREDDEVSATTQTSKPSDSGHDDTATTSSSQPMEPPSDAVVPLRRSSRTSKPPNRLNLWITVTRDTMTIIRKTVIWCSWTATVCVSLTASV